MAFSHLLDSTAIDATNTQLELEDSANGIQVKTMEFQDPPRKNVWATSQDTIGSALVAGNYENRQINYVIRCTGTEGVMRAAVSAISKKAGKIAKYGGTLTRTLHDGTLLYFDLLDATVSIPGDMEWWFHNKNYVEVALGLTARPFAYGTKQYLKSDLTWTTTAASQGTISETTLPEVTVTFPAPAGDVPALGEMTVVEQSGTAQSFFHWGIQGRNYSSASSAALAFQGEACLAYNGSTALAVSGASGGTVLNQGGLISDYIAVISLASSGTVYPTHVGDYSVWARLYPVNSGTVTVAFEWAQSDLSTYTRNAGTAIVPSRSGAFTHTCLGQVKLSKVVSGVQRWDGRIVAKSTTNGDDLGVDRVYLLPTAEGYAEALAPTIAPSPTSLTARSDFTTESGAITGDSLLTGGTWGGAGDTDDFTVTAGVASRTATSDTGGALTNGRLITASGSSLTAQAASVTVTATAAAGLVTYQGLLLRYVDASNFLFVGIQHVGATTGILEILAVVAGVSSGIGNPTIFTSVGVSSTIQASVSAAGYVSASLSQAGVTVASQSYSSSVLATGGVLASGKAGIEDYWASATASTRTYDNFTVWVPSIDAAIFASRRALITSSAAVRQDSAGTAYGTIPRYQGPYFTIPTTNVGGTARLIVKPVRNDPYNAADAAIDDVGVMLAYTPQYLTVPA